MPAKRKRQVNTRSGGKRRGKGFFGDLWKNVKGAAGSLGNTAWNSILKPTLQSSKIVSSTLDKLPIVGPSLGYMAREKGFGKKKGGKRRGRGSVLMRDN